MANNAEKGNFYFNKDGIIILILKLKKIIGQKKKRKFYSKSIWSMVISGQILRSSYLGGIIILYRTDNTIKNHFYSKLRKFLRKIMKNLNSENIFEENNIDSNYYTPDKIYRIIKKNNVPYFMLSKECIVDLIIKQNLCEANPNNGKLGKLP
jgi:hypothetical protein